MWVPINSGNCWCSRHSQVVRCHSDNGRLHSMTYLPNSESCSENTCNSPVAPRQSLTGLFTPRAFFLRSWSFSGFWKAQDMLKGTGLTLGALGAVEMGRTFGGGHAVFDQILQTSNKVWHPDAFRGAGPSKKDTVPIVWGHHGSESRLGTESAVLSHPPLRVGPPLGCVFHEGVRICVGLFLFGAHRRGLGGANLYMFVWSFGGLSCR